MNTAAENTGKLLQKFEMDVYSPASDNFHMAVAMKISSATFKTEAEEAFTDDRTGLR